jgi:hypothetical protein
LRQRERSATRGIRPTRFAHGSAALCCALALAGAAITASAADGGSEKYLALAPGVHWSGNTMTWYYAPAGHPDWATDAQMLPLIQQAMNAWSSQCGVQFNYLGISAQQAPANDGASVIGWVAGMDRVASTSWYTYTTLMTEADVELKPSANASAAAAYPMILHELGHAIGLDHSEVQGSVMAGPPASAAYSYATVLAADDVAGCQALYGPPSVTSAQRATDVCGTPPPTATRADACAQGMTGQIVQQETYACTAGGWASTGWQVVQNSCASQQSVVGADIRAVEFYHAGLDHYFMTADPAEQAALMNGAFDGQWRPTGNVYPVWKSAYPNLQPMCRFYGDPSVDPATGQRRGPNSHFYTANPTECRLVPQVFPVWLFEGYAFYAALPDANGACPAGSQPVYRFFRPQGDPNHRYVTSAADRQEMTARGWLLEGVAWCAGL